MSYEFKGKVINVNTFSYYGLVKETGAKVEFYFEQFLVDGKLILDKKE